MAPYYQKPSRFRSSLSNGGLHPNAAMLARPGRLPTCAQRWFGDSKREIRLGSFSSGRWTALLGLLVPGTALAQSALWSPSPAVTLPSAVEAYQTNRTAAMQVFTPTDLAPAIASTTQPFQWGSITVHPHLDYEFLYGTGIQSSPGRQSDSIWQKVSPGTTINLGDHWLVDYTPTLNYYSATDLKDTVNHAARVSGGTACGDWFLQVSQAFTDYSDPDVETASQSDRQNFATTVNANDQINSKLSLALSVSQVVNDITRSGYSINQLQNLSDSRTWSTTDWLNYEFNPRLTAGVGAGAGFISENIGYDIVFEQAQGQIHWRATDKISFQISRRHARTAVFAQRPGRPVEPHLQRHHSIPTV